MKSNSIASMILFIFVNIITVIVARTITFKGNESAIIDFNNG